MDEKKSLLREVLQLLSEIEVDRKSCPACWVSYHDHHAPGCLLVRISQSVYSKEVKKGSV